jgi:hypothetical protein
MIIHKQHRHILNDNILIEYEIESRLVPKCCRFELDKKFEFMVDDSCDAALVALLIPAMMAREDITIKGAVSAKLFNSINNGLMDLLLLIMPFLHRVDIYVTELQTNEYKASGVATGYSGGVDSYSLIFDYFEKTNNESYNITHLLFNNVGSHGAGSAANLLFEKRFDKLECSAKKLNLPFIKINSNMDDFYSKKINFQQTHTFRNASIGLLLQKEISTLLYASTFSFSELAVKETYDISYADLIILPLISTSNIEILSQGGQYSRLEKTLNITGMSQTFESLDVCVSINNLSSFINCGKCWKCLRTLFTLELSNELHKYTKAFDIEAYELSKRRYLYTLIASNDPLLLEIVDFADGKDYKYPLIIRFLKFFRIAKLIRTIKQLICKRSFFELKT